MIIRRDNTEKVIQSNKLVVGDVLSITTGEQLICDGILLEGSNVTVDESEINEVSMAIRKDTVGNCILEMDKMIAQGTTEDELLDVPTPILMSGTTIRSGSGKMLVIAVGSNTSKNTENITTATTSVLSSRSTELEETRFEKSMTEITTKFSLYGSIISVLIFLIVLIRILQNEDDNILISIIDAALLFITLLVAVAPDNISRIGKLSLESSI